MRDTGGHQSGIGLTLAAVKANALVGRFIRLPADRRAGVAIMFAVLAPVLVFLSLGVTDLGMGLNGKGNLQGATDAAALAVSAAIVSNPNTSEAALKTYAQSLLTADSRMPNPVITSFHVCAPVQNDCSANGSALKMNTVTLDTSAQAPCTLCIGGGTSKTVVAATTSVIGFGATIQLNVVMDSSASMIVGATPTDVNTISNWVTANWNSVKPGDPPPYGNGSGDNPSCAFACHDEGGSTTTADIAVGLTNAHSAGATTRFDVMTSAAQQLVSHVQAEATSSQVYGKNSYVFNIMSFDTSLHQYGANNLVYAAASAQIGKIAPGLDTYLSTDMTSLIKAVGTTGNGASASTPLKFVILVTDGLQSDRSNNWNCTVSNTYDPAWGYGPTCIGGYDTSINTAQCAQLKNNGVVLAVLETPYVPLTGQDPNVQPYEKTVRHTIYPNGPGTASMISGALQTCASSGYYFQATSSSQIATGFLTLADRFLAQTAYLSQ